MSVEDLITRINQDRDRLQRVREMLSEARSTEENSFNWGNGRDVGELVGGIAGIRAGSELGARAGAVGEEIEGAIEGSPDSAGRFGNDRSGGGDFGSTDEPSRDETNDNDDRENRNDRNSVNITGDAAYQHEREQAALYAERQGGGQVHLYGQSTQGIDGAYYSDPNANPESTSPDHYISLKDKSNVTKEINVFRSIRENASQVSAAGYAGQTEIHVIVPFESEQMRKFIQEQESNILPPEGVFQKILLDCADGELVEIDASGNLSEPERRTYER